MGRDLSLCHPELQEKAKQLVAECAKQGLKIGIGECFRTVAEQDALYAKGRTAAGNIVTNARGSSYSSHHQWGTAFDFYRNDGKGAYNTSDRFFDRVGAIGKKLGLEWGGDWTSPVDKPHFQLPCWGSTTGKLRHLYGTPDNFKKTWSPIQKKKEDDEVVEKAKLIVNGKTLEVSRIMKDGNNYIKIRDIADAIGYNVTSNGSIAVLTKK